METSPLCLHNSPPLGTANSRICGSKDTSGSEGFWRPWIPTPKDAERQRVKNVELHSPSETTEDSVKLAQYTHPVRLFWPKSKCFDYMYHEAEALLRNFPVQATIFFYDESENEEDSDSTDHESGAEMDN
ncbi:protein ripply2 isoform X2 [Ahaetulla prasina]|uniref:protein ripply2 isoform X2 n=1 Tax=Ahaetulla prasina TaxID=499056 RepID=UPI002648A7DB|nr:protein ripply2 isoform X2 [Ahaetulla prasina]